MPPRSIDAISIRVCFSSTSIPIVAKHFPTIVPGDHPARQRRTKTKPLKVVKETTRSNRQTQIINVHSQEFIAILFNNLHITNSLFPPSANHLFLLPLFLTPQTKCLQISFTRFFFHRHQPNGNRWFIVHCLTRDVYFPSALTFYDNFFLCFQFLFDTAFFARFFYLFLLELIFTIHLGGSTNTLNREFLQGSAASNVTANCPTDN